jgi:uncharacterized protein (DUF885 family)
MRRAILPLLLVLAATCLVAQGPGVDFGAFVQRYADDWMRFHTNAASSRRYFTGAEEDAIERQIEPVTSKQRNDELELIRRGLSELGRFDRARLAPTDQRSFDIIRWDLQTQQNGAAFDDEHFPFAQNYGVDANLISLLTVNHTA